MSLEKKHIDSHIQMPRFMLKRFHNRYNKFCYYDVEKNHISRKGSAKSLNTQEGYYSEKIEEYLEKNVETSWSKMVRNIEKIDFEKERFCFDSQIHKAALKFISALIVRDPIMLENNEIKEWSSLFTDQEIHDGVVLKGLRYMNRYEKEGFKVSFIDNQTDIPFVLPIAGIYEAVLKGQLVIVLPIDPDKAIFMYKSDTDVIPFYTVEDAQIIKHMNLSAFTSQVKRGKGYVICPEERELFRLVNERGIELKCF